MARTTWDCWANGVCPAPLPPRGRGVEIPDAALPGHAPPSNFYAGEFPKNVIGRRYPEITRMKADQVPERKKYGTAQNPAVCGNRTSPFFTPIGIFRAWGPLSGSGSSPGNRPLPVFPRMRNQNPCLVTFSNIAANPAVVVQPNSPAGVTKRGFSLRFRYFDPGRSIRLPPPSLALRIRVTKTRFRHHVVTIARASGGWHHGQVSGADIRPLPQLSAFALRKPLFRDVSVTRGRPRAVIED